MIRKVGAAAVDECIRQLDRIPKHVDTKLFIKPLLKDLEAELKRQTLRYNSYGKR